MEIRDSGLYGPGSLAGLTGSVQTAPYSQSERRGQNAESALDPDRATLSIAGGSLAEGSDDAGVREAKVQSVRTALLAGTYAVPAASVAASAIGAMLGQGA
jgi:anti-sigma28 factor (negative regulator of flagellin synthesis)